MINPTDCLNLKSECVIKCPICFEIPQFPIIFHVATSNVTVATQPKLNGVLAGGI